MTIQQINSNTAHERFKSGALLIVVREQEEVNLLSFDVSNMLHIPLTDFEQNFIKIPKNQQLIIACRSGGRSLRAAHFLFNNGYTLIANLENGITEWVQKGFPTKSIEGNINNQNNCCSNEGCC